MCLWIALHSFVDLYTFVCGFLRVSGRGSIHLSVANQMSGAWTCSYNMRLLVDVVEVQGQDVVLAAHVHAVVVLVHAQDPVVGRVEDVGEVMSGTGGSQLCVETQI